MRVAILDYGAGNLHSLAKALSRAGVEVSVETDGARALSSGALILPGVGAFSLAAEALAPHIPSIRTALSDGFPCLGICLGMQLLFDSSEEGDGDGIGFFSGNVRRLVGPRVPQIGWNDLERTTGELFETSGLRTAYFANSFVCSPQDAYRCFMRTEMDYLVVEGYVLSKKDQPSFTDVADWRKELELD